jgi:hypothetical protein
MWEIRCVKVYDSQRRGGLQFRRQELCPQSGSGDQAADHELLEAGVMEILASGEGWEPFAYTDAGVTMWLRRERGSGWLARDWLEGRRTAGL